MGIPVSSYEVFSKLLSTNSSQSESIKKTLRSFDLFCFILYDPINNVEFFQELSSSFEFLDRLTGEHLLFITVLNPPNEWKSIASQRDYYREYENWEQQWANESLGPNGFTSSKNPEKELFALITQLNLSYNDLPCIIVNTSLYFNKMWRFNTNAEELRRQMSGLGALAEEIHSLKRRVNKDWKIINKTIEDRFTYYQIDRLGKENTSLDKSLVKVLMEYFCFLEASDKKSALYDAKKVLNDFQTEIKNIRVKMNTNNNSESEIKITEDLMIKMMTLISLLTDYEPTNHAYYTDLIDMNLLENDSRQMLKTAQIIKRSLNKEDGYLKLIAGPPDYSPLAICYAKVFEREIGFSVIHWCRSLFGITLPDYFGRYQKGVSAIQNTGKGRTVNFNRWDRNRPSLWVPPELGTARFGCKAVVDNHGIPGQWTNHEWDTLMIQWERIATNRNIAAHDQLLTLQQTEEIENALKILNNQSDFKKFYEMRVLYSGKG